MRSWTPKPTEPLPRTRSEVALQPSHTRLIVTASHKARPETIDRATNFATENGYRYVPRSDESLDELLTSVDAAFVMTNGAMTLATQHGTLKAHLGTAFIRLKSIDRGEGDPLIRAGDIRTGDRIVDTTFGLGRDALVAACAAGATGSLTAIESSDALYHLGHHGLTKGPLSPAAVASVGNNLDPAPVELVHDDAVSWLADQTANTADVVLIDPMFTSPKTSDSGFTLLRSVADTNPLTKDWIEQAQRVARRAVVVKTGAPPEWFDDIDISHVHSHSNANWWRVNASETCSNQP